MATSTWGNPVKLIDYLRVPYVLEAESTEATPGVWVSRVSYPELPDCVEQAATIEEAIDKLERRRIEMIVAMLRSGTPPRIPRPPLASSQPYWLIAHYGLQNELLDLLDQDERAFPASVNPEETRSGPNGRQRVTTQFGKGFGYIP
jgi:predicted RNase H-like HicB family nuclease